MIVFSRTNTLLIVLTFLVFALGSFPSISIVKFTAEAKAQQIFAHNVRPDGILSPDVGTRFRPNAVYPVKIQLYNPGDSDEAHVKVRAEIKAVTNDTNHIYSVIYQDTIEIPYWQHKQFIDTSFKDFKLSSLQQIVITITTLLDSDQNRQDDTLSLSYDFRYENDIYCVGVQYPTPTDTVLAKTSFHPRAYFLNVGGISLFEVPARVILRRCEDHGLVFLADTLITALQAHEGKVLFPFPSQQGNFDTRQLPPGCYEISAIVRLATDGDRINDTAVSHFTIVPHEPNNDFSADSIVLPFRGDGFALGAAVPVFIAFTNKGEHQQSSGAVNASIVDATGRTIYSDTAAIENIGKGESRMVQFKNFIPTAPGRYIIKGVSLLRNDEFAPNDVATSYFFAGTPGKAHIVQILNPVSDEVKIVGKSFAPTVQLEWQGIKEKSDPIPVRLEIYSCKDSRVVFSDSVTVSLSYSPSRSIVSFHNNSDTSALSNLLPGCYRVTTTEYSHSITPNDTVTYYFSVRGLYDISTDSILSPVTSAFVPIDSALSIAARFSNWDSTIELEDIHVRAQILDRNGNVLMSRDSAISSWYSGETKDISFGRFALPHVGIYNVRVISVELSDRNKSNDTLIRSFYYGLPFIDAKAVQILYPTESSSIFSGEPIRVAAQYRLSNASVLSSAIPFHLQISTFFQRTPVFESDTTVSILPEDSTIIVYFPILSGDTSTEDIVPGFYRCTVISNLAGDRNAVNDTAYSYFTVRPNLNIRSIASSNDLLDQNYPNPFDRKTSIHYVLAEQSNVTLRVYNILGNCVATPLQDFSQVKGDHRYTIDLSNQPSGQYFYSLSITGSHRATLMRGMQIQHP